MFIKARVFYPPNLRKNVDAIIGFITLIGSFYEYGFPRRMFLEIKLKFSQFRPMDTNTFHAQIDLLLGEQRYAKTKLQSS